MNKTKKPVEVQEGSIDLISLIVRTSAYAQNNNVQHADALKIVMEEMAPGSTDKTKCANCGRSMKITGYEADLHNALLLLAMGREVKKNIAEGMSFTEANKVHLPSLQVSDAVKKRITQCDYLRFLKQPENLRRTGYWVITDLGWKALRGEQVPRIAYYWNGNLIRRSDEVVNLAGMFEIHRDQVAKAVARRRKVRDHTAEIGVYDPKEWAVYGGTQDGTLF